MPQVRLRPIALPAEHGGWALVGAPILLGLWVAPSAAGAWIGVAALGLFLVRQPLDLAVSDWRRGRRYPRTRWAEGFALGYVLAALVAFVLAWAAARGPFWPPLALAAPLAGVQLAHDLAARGRARVAQVCGAIAASALGAAIAMAAGWPPGDAAVLWALLASQAVAAIVYIGIRLRRARGFDAPGWPAHVAHLVALATAATLAWAGPAPWLGVAVFAALAFRAALGLRPHRGHVAATRLGVQEVCFSLLTVAGIAVGVRWGW